MPPFFYTHTAVILYNYFPIRRYSLEHLWYYFQYEAIFNAGMNEPDYKIPAENEVNPVHYRTSQGWVHKPGRAS